MEETISLGEIFDILKKRIGMILVTTLASILIAGAVTFFIITPKYSASTQMIVQSSTAENPNTNLQNDINGNVLLINTYKDMITGDLVIDTARDQLQAENNYSLTSENLRAMVEVEQSQNSQMFQVIATAEHPQEAAVIANKVSQIFQEKAQEVLAVNKVTITSNAQTPTKPVSPNNKLNLAIGAALGIMLGVGIAFLLELVDKTVKDERFVIETLDLPILGQVTEMNKKELSYSRNAQSPKATHKTPAKAATSAGSRQSRKRV
ncbi:YveK family protein [Candidatus Enterococcus ferrettii]|uniref:Capsular polysaccharide biosynthesis protein CpsC n=1 Tax=Candidatus Enterococcus ferrettii TaxID=2815324 RepID=A0ABV0EID4_9ENTE|nr:Wzz/FepE/Etk N-terminal domain-containing protein [Enterococcus sp. 665A]MBO1340530.1 tyrosine protein kinase [Enterococcus sp. 665A]